MEWADGEDDDSDGEEQAGWPHVEPGDDAYKVRRRMSPALTPDNSNDAGGGDTEGKEGTNTLAAADCAVGWRHASPTQGAHVMNPWFLRLFFATPAEKVRLLVAAGPAAVAAFLTPPAGADAFDAIDDMIQWKAALDVKTPYAPPLPRMRALIRCVAEAVALLEGLPEGHFAAAALRKFVNDCVTHVHTTLFHSHTAADPDAAFRWLCAVNAEVLLASQRLYPQIQAWADWNLGVFGCDTPYTSLRQSVFRTLYSAACTDVPVGTHHRFLRHGLRMWVAAAACPLRLDVQPQHPTTLATMLFHIILRREHAGNMGEVAVARRMRYALLEHPAIVTAADFTDLLHTFSEDAFVLQLASSPVVERVRVGAWRRRLVALAGWVRTRTRAGPGF